MPPKPTGKPSASSGGTDDGIRVTPSSSSSSPSSPSATAAASSSSPSSPPSSPTAQQVRTFKTRPKHSAEVVGPKFEQLEAVAVGNSVRIVDTDFDDEYCVVQQKKVETGLTGTIRDVATSKSGKYFAAASSSGSVGIYSGDKPGDDAFLKLLVTFEVSYLEINSLCFSPNETLLAVVANVNLTEKKQSPTIHMFDMNTLKEKNKLTTSHRGNITGVSFSSNNTYVAACSRDHFISVWTVSSGANYSRLDGHTSDCCCIAFGPTAALSDFILSGSVDKKAILWKNSTKTKLRVFGEHTSYVTDVEFGPGCTASGGIVATACNDTFARIFDFTTTALKIKISALTGCPMGRIHFLNSTTLLTADSKTVRAWSTVDTKQRTPPSGKSAIIHHPLVPSVNASRGGIASRATFDTNQIFVADDSRLLFVHLSQGRAAYPTLTFPSKINSVNFSKNASFLITSEVPDTSSSSSSSTTTSTKKIHIFKEKQFHVEAKASRGELVCDSCSRKYNFVPENCKCTNATCQKKPLLWNADTKDCERCKKTFTFFQRKTHCRACCKCICNECCHDSSATESLAFIWDLQKRHRVCLDCLERGHEKETAEMLASTAADEYGLLEGIEKGSDDNDSLDDEWLEIGNQEEIEKRREKDEARKRAAAERELKQFAQEWNNNNNNNNQDNNHNDPNANFVASFIGGEEKDQEGEEQKQEGNVSGNKKPQQQEGEGSLSSSTKKQQQQQQEQEQEGEGGGSSAAAKAASAAAGGGGGGVNENISTSAPPAQAVVVMTPQKCLQDLLESSKEENSQTLADVKSIRDAQDKLRFLYTGIVSSATDLEEKVGKSENALTDAVENLASAVASKEKEKIEAAGKKRDEATQQFIAVEKEFETKAMTTLWRGEKAMCVSLEALASDIMASLTQRNAACLSKSQCSNEFFTSMKASVDGLSSAEQKAKAAEAAVLAAAAESKLSFNRSLSQNLFNDVISTSNELSQRIAVQMSFSAPTLAPLSNELPSIVRSSCSSSSSPENDQDNVQLNFDQLSKLTSQYNEWHKEFIQAQERSRQMYNRIDTLLQTATREREQAISVVVELVEDSLFQIQNACWLMVERIRSICSAAKRLEQFRIRVSDAAENFHRVHKQHEEYCEELALVDVELARLRHKRELSKEDKAEQTRKLSSTVAKTRRAQGKIIPSLVQMVTLLYPEFRSGIDEATTRYLESDGIVSGDISWESFNVDTENPVSTAGENARHTVYRATKISDDSSSSPTSSPTSAASGGSGGQQQQQQEFFALKEYSLAANADRFYREVRTLSRLSHPHVMPVLAAFVHSDSSGGSHGYMIMPWLAGGTLDKWADRHREKAPHHLMRVLHNVLEALAHLHAASMIHSDVKDTNVMLSSEDETATPFLSDFDTAKSVQELSQTLVMTAAATRASGGSVAGTFKYLSPEAYDVMMGMSTTGANSISTAIDIYSYGVMFLILRDPKATVEPGIVPKLPAEKFTSDEISLLQGLFEKDPRKRLTAAQALRHPAMDLARAAAERESRVRAEEQRVQNEQSRMQQAEAQLALQKQSLESTKAHVLKQQEELRRQTAAPLYWTNSLDHPTPARVPVPRGSERFDQIQKSINASQNVQWTGYGRDIKPGSPKYSSFQVVNVWHLENADLWRKYCVTRESIINKNRANGGIKVLTPPRKAGFEWADSELQLKTREAQELLLMHGTKPEIINVICKMGADARVCSDQGLLGSAIYFAQDSDKSDQYCVPDSNGSCWMFLCRVTLGSSAILLNTANNIRRPNCLTCGKNIARDGPCPPSHVLADSNIGECTANNSKAYLQRHREYTIHDNNMTYFEYLIEYKRV